MTCYTYECRRTRMLQTTYITPFPPIDSIQALVQVWRIRGKRIRIALCCVVYDICAQ